MIKSVSEGRTITAEIRRLTTVVDAGLTQLEAEKETAGSDSNPTVQAALNRRQQFREAADADVAKAALSEIGRLAGSVDRFTSQAMPAPTPAPAPAADPAPTPAPAADPAPAPAADPATPPQ